MTGGLSAEDREQIRDTVARYAWALDTGDIEGFVECFTPDGVLVWDSFATPGEWQGAENLRAFVTFLVALPTTAGRQHHVSNIVIEGDAQEARVKAYVSVIVRQPEGGSHPVTVLGWYDDTFRRGEQGWKIARRVIRDWSGPVLARLAGQNGERDARPMPAVLAGIPGRSMA